MEQEMTGPTREEVEEWVREAGLDWHRGFTFDDDDANRYEKLAALAFAAGARAAGSVSACKHGWDVARRDAEKLRVELAWQRLCWKNVRMLAARHRNEEWAQHMLRFCDEAGVKASPLRDAAFAAGSRSGEDSERLQWMQFHGARVSWGNDDEMCCVVWSDRDGEQYRTALHSDWRAAIDEARGGSHA